MTKVWRVHLEKMAEDLWRTAGRVGGGSHFMKVFMQVAGETFDVVEDPPDWRDAPRIMSDDDRAAVIEMIVDQQADSAYDDRASAAEDLVESLRPGLRGLVEYTDAELLDEIGGSYCTAEGEFARTDFEPDYLAQDEVFKLWARYRMPDLLCEWCLGTGAKTSTTDPGGSDGCSLCEGTGVRLRPPQQSLVELLTEEGK